MTAVLLISLALGVVVILLAGIGQSKPTLARTLALALGVRLALIVFHIFVAPLPSSQSDAIGFQKNAVYLSMMGFPDVLSAFRPGSGAYYWLLAIVYSIFGDVFEFALVTNAILGTCTVYLSWLLAHEVSHDTNSAGKTAQFIAIFPTFVLFSALLLRETILMTLFTVGTLGTVYSLTRRQARWVLLAIAGFSGAVVFHGGMIFSFFALTIISVLRLFWGLRSRESDSAASSLAALVVSGFGLLAISASGIANAKLEKYDTLLDKGVQGQGRTAYIDELEVLSPTQFVLQSPVRAFLFLYTPFPWMIRELLDIIGFMDACVYLWGSYVIISRWRNRRKAPEEYALLIIFVSGVLMFGVGTTNYGTAMRHRLKLVPVMLVLASVPAAGLARYRAPASSLALEPNASRQ